MVTDRRNRVTTTINDQLGPLLPDQRDGFWMPTLSGDIWYTPDMQTWRLLREHRTMPKSNLICVHQQQGVWITETNPKAPAVTKTKLCQLGADGTNLQSFEQFPASADPSWAVAEQKNQLWVATYTKGLLHFEGDTWSRYAHVNYESPMGLPSRRVERVFFDYQQRLWAITSGGAAVFLDGRWVTVYIIVPKRDTGTDTVWPAIGSIQTVDVSTDGRVWLGTNQGEVVWFNTQQPLERFPYDVPKYEPHQIPLPPVRK